MADVRASRIVGGNGAYGRNPSDLYPTPPDVTVALMRFLNLPRRTVVWEPASGEGDMAGVLQTFCDTVYATDVLDGTDFLKSSVDDADWIITNPPFSLAEQFIRRAAELEKPFAFALKSQYWHAKTRAGLFSEIPPSYVLPLTWRPNFNFKTMPGKSPLMDMIWCVWLTPWKKDVQTVYCPLMRPEMGGKEND